MSIGEEHLSSMTNALWLAAVLAAGGIAGGETQFGTVELALPRAVAAHEAVWLQIRVGALPRGARLRVSTSDGVPVGTISPFGVRGGQAAGSYTIPLPKSAIANGRVRLQLEIEEPGTTARAPRPAEVENVDLVYVPISD